MILRLLDWQIHNGTELIVQAAELDDDENPSSIEIRRRIVDMVEEMARDGVIWRKKEWSEILASKKWMIGIGVIGLVPLGKGMKMKFKEDNIFVLLLQLKRVTQCSVLSAGSVKMYLFEVVGGNAW